MSTGVDPFPVFVDLTMARMLIDIFTRSIYETKHEANNIRPMFSRTGIFSTMQETRRNETFFLVPAATPYTLCAIKRWACTFLALRWCWDELSKRLENVAHNKLVFSFSELQKQTSRQTYRIHRIHIWRFLTHIRDIFVLTLVSLWSRTTRRVTSMCSTIRHHIMTDIGQRYHTTGFANSIRMEQMSGFFPSI